MLSGVAALVIATLFTGAALYITLVEHPARLELDDRALLAQWQPSYRRALPIQAGLAVAGGVAGLIAWWTMGGAQWLAGSLALLANWPFTMIAIMPTNKRLQAMLPEDGGANSRALLRHWIKLHNVRSALGCLALLLFAWGVVAGDQQTPPAEVSTTA